VNTYCWTSVTCLGGLQGCEMLRIPHCLDNRLTDGGKVVSPMHPPHFTPEKHYFYVSGTGVLNISQPYRPPKPVSGIALLYGDGVCFLWGTNWTVSTATSSQYLTVNCEPIV
jgi:hypothetical protein